MKHFLFRQDHTPVVAYVNGEPWKIVKVSFRDSKVVLEDRSDKRHVTKESISFASIREKGAPQLREFMKEKDGTSIFHISLDPLHDQICKIAAREDQIQELFRQAHFRYLPPEQPLSLSPQGAIDALLRLRPRKGPGKVKGNFYFSD